MSKNTNLSFLTDYITADITNGRIGINNASPTVAFDVTGVANFSSSITATKIITSTTSDGDPQLGFFTNASTGTSAEAVIYIKNGATTNDATFVEATGTNFTTTGGFVQDGGIVGTGTALAGGMSLMVRANADMRFYTNGHTNERMRIGSDGTKYFGIYNTSRLQINPTGENIYSYTNSYYIYGLFNDSNSLSIESAFAGNIIFRAQAQSTSSSPTTATERMRITSAGNVGIGTSSPSQKLEVVGTTHLSSAAGNITGVNIIPGSVTNTFQTIGESNSGTVRFFANIVTGWANWDNWASSYIDFKVQSYPSGTEDRTFTAMQIRPTGDIRMSILTGTGTRTVVADATGQLSAPVSDESVKENITPIGYGIKEIMQMNPVWFEFKDEFENYGKGRQNGNIAQELEKIIPEAVFLTPQTNKKGIEYGQLHAVYIKAIQELKTEIETLKQK